ncbi:hypothetical protein WJX84_009066 [Apatococcus fuscideae]|uniref:Uncharacterized protein n=1 Tax=Apatococcus fuscideae TaxID=2026836 RepID=A0AAW1SUQ3_9CHLO
MDTSRLLHFSRNSAWILLGVFFFVNIIAYRSRPHLGSNPASPPGPAFAPASTNAVYVALPWWSTRESKFYDIPDFLKDGGEYGSRVRLLRSLSDYGPATKFVPIIQELKQQKMENARVIIVDDDQEYPWEMVAAYDKWSQALPDSALTMRGHKMLDKPIDWGKIAFGNIIHTFELPELTCVDIITAVGSYMIRPRFFTAELWEALYIHETHGDASTRLRGARDADDIWISGMLARNGVPRNAIPGRNKAWTPQQPQEEYFTGMTIHPWEPAMASQSGTPALGGGSDGDNSQLIQAFWDKWSCFGNLMTLPKCPKNAAGHDQEFMHGVPCVQDGGSIMHG